MVKGKIKQSIIYGEGENGLRTFLCGVIELLRNWINDK